MANPRPYAGKDQSESPVPDSLTLPVPTEFNPYTVTQGTILGGPDNEDPVTFPEGVYKNYLLSAPNELNFMSPEDATNRNLALRNLKKLINDHGVYAGLEEVLGKDNIPQDLEDLVISSDKDVRFNALSQVANLLNQKGIQDRDIVYQLTNVDPQSFFTGIEREYIPVIGGSVASLATGLGLAAVGISTAPVIAGGFFAGLGGYALVDAFIEDEPVLPEDIPEYEAGRTATGFITGPTMTYGYLGQRKIRDAAKEAQEAVARGNFSDFISAYYKALRNKTDVIQPINQPASELLSNIAIRNQQRALNQNAAFRQLKIANQQKQDLIDNNKPVPKELEDRIAVFREQTAPVQKETASKGTRFNAVLERMMARNLTDAQKNKKAFLSNELLTNLGASGGTILAVQGDPDAMVSRLFFEMGTGLAAPTVVDLAMKSSLALPAVRSLFPGQDRNINESYAEAVKRKFNRITEEKYGEGALTKLGSYGQQRKQRAAVKEIMDYLVEGGSDIQAITKKLLQAENVEGLNVVALIDDPNIQAINSAILSDVSKLSKPLADSHLESRAILRAKLFQLAGIIETGDLNNADRNDALKMMFELESEMFNADLQITFDNLVDKITKAAGATLRRDPETGEFDPSGGDFDVTEFSEQLFNAVETFIQASRGRQSVLYDAVPNAEIIKNVGPDGKEIDMPFFVRKFFEDDMFGPTAVEYAEKYMAEFPELTKFVQRYAPQELKDAADIDVASQVAEAVRESTVVKRLNREVSELDKLAQNNPNLDVVPENVSDLIVLKEELKKIELPVGRGAAAGQARQDKNNALTYIDKKIKLKRAEQNAAEAARSKLSKAAVKSTPVKEDIPLDVAQLRTVLKDLRNTQRTARASGDFEKARRAGDMAQSIEVTMNGIDPSQTIVQEKLNLANAYTRAFYDVFERSFVGNMMQQSARYGARMLPEDLSSRILSGSNSRSLRRFDELRDTVNFLENEASAFTPEQIEKLKETDFGEFVMTPDEIKQARGEIEGPLEVFLRDAARKFFKTKIDSEGVERTEVNMRGLSEFLNTPSAKKILKAFPLLEQDLKNSLESEKLLGVFSNFRQKEQAVLNNNLNKVVRDILGTENVGVAINDALNSKNPVKSLDVLFNRFNKILNDDDFLDEIIKDPERFSTTIPGVSDFENLDVMRKRALQSKGNLRESLKKSLKQAFIKSAVAEGGGFDDMTFNSTLAHRRLFGNLRNTDKTPMNLLIKEGLFSKEEANRLEQFLDKMRKLDGSQNPNEFLSFGQQFYNPLYDFYLRVGGSAAGAKFQKLFPGNVGAGQLVAAEAGSRFFRRLFQQIPASMHVKAMAEMMADPQLLGQMMLENLDPTAAKRNARSIATWFADKGYIPAKIATIFTARESDLLDSVGKSKASPEEIIEKVYTELPAASEEEEQPAAQPAPQQPAVPPVTEAPATRPEVVVPQQQPRPAARPLQTSMAPPAPQSGSVNPQTAARLSAAFPEDEILAMASPAKSGIGSLMG